MSAAENKQLINHAYDALAKGDGRPFVDLLAEDVRWTIIGNTAWSGTWEGSRSVRTELLDSLFAQFESTYRAQADRVLAEGDWVVIESHGDVIAKSGKPYRNTYCYVCRMEDGKVRELTEYCDTELIAEALAPPEAVPAA
jgi:ketosteroid isomerase-like protein